MVAGSESSKFRACGSNIYDPNISFLAGTFLMGSKIWAEGISINYQQQINFSSGEVSGNFVDYRLNSTAINSVYGASDTNQPEAVRVLSLVKAY